MSLRVKYEDLETVGFDGGGGEILSYQGQVFTGTIVQFDENNNLICEEEFKNGHLGGGQRTFYPNGQMEQEYFIKYNKNYGLHRKWDESGTLTYEYNWGPEPL
ncbi:toxin-antitoxin system YwqK family antitoxin [Pedobacter glucosidilyticus]|uniref:toxin-antitoxin system YwqK family antitoxin n=1 Tax=Pedobacter glucosidilyticus TaxID=1122941 RepID=UPI000421B0AB|nr:hypothetical protein [Pedobacter glucosidilyticus]